MKQIADAITFAIYAKVWGLIAAAAVALILAGVAVAEVTMLARGLGM